MTYEKNYQYIKKLLENRKYFLQMIDFIVENKEDRKIYKSKIEKVFGNKKRNVLIIGNGPSVKKMKIGKFIDQGDFFIIRINNYEISRQLFHECNLDFDISAEVTKIESPERDNSCDLLQKP